MRKDEKVYYLLYNSGMEVYEDAFSFINVYRTKNCSENTQIKDVTALKFLFSFEEICGTKLEDFSLNDIYTLKAFLHGYIEDGQVYEFRGLERRTNNSVNAYLATYREYLRYIKPDAKAEHPLFDSRHIPTPAFPMDYRGPKNDIYRVNDKTPNPVVKVPEHFS